MVVKVIGEKRLKEMQTKKDLKQKWRGTCSLCYKIFFDNQSRDRHMKNVHSDTVIEEDIEAGIVEEQGFEKGDDIRGAASFLLKEILDKVVKKSKTNFDVKCPECD